MGIFNRNKKKIEEIETSVDLEADIKSYVTQLNLILEVSQAVAGHIELDEVLGIILDKLVGQLGYTFSGLFLIENNILKLRKISVPGLIKTIFDRVLGGNLLDVYFNLDDPIERKSLAVVPAVEGKFTESSDVSQFSVPRYLDPSKGKLIGTLTGIKLLVGIPIIINDKPLGCLIVVSNNPSVGERDKKVLLTFANQISIAIYNSQLFGQVQTQVDVLTAKNRDLQSLYNLTSKIMQTLDPIQVAQNAVDSLPQDQSMVGAVISIIDENGAAIRAVAASQNQLSAQVKKLIGDFSQYITPLEGEAVQKNISIQTVKTGVAHFTNELNDYLLPAIPSQFTAVIAKILNIKSLAVYPIVRRDKPVGVIAFFMKSKTVEELQDNEKQLLSTYTNQIAIALENAFLLTNLEKAKGQIEEAYRKEKDMMDILGHELRTPLTIARNAILMIDMEYKKPTPNMEMVMDLLDKSKENIRREVSTLQTVLSSTRLENDRVQVNLVKVDANDVIHDSLDGFDQDAEKKKLKLVTDIPQETIYIWAGREQTQEIVDNLISNAVKYTTEGSITIKLSATDKEVMISVQDTGEGIPETELPNLGKKFHRINNYTTTTENSSFKVVRPGGTGIGLYVVTGFLKSMGGRLDVKSKVGEGSIFTAVLPRYSGQDQKTKA